MMKPYARRDLLKIMGAGLGSLGLANVLGAEGLLGDTSTPAAPGRSDPLAPKAGHIRPRAKSIIHLFMNGGPSHVDTFDHKPALTKYAGQRPPAVNLSTE